MTLIWKVRKTKVRYYTADKEKKTVVTSWFQVLADRNVVLLTKLLQPDKGERTAIVSYSLQG